MEADIKGELNVYIGSGFMRLLQHTPAYATQKRTDKDKS